MLNRVLFKGGKRKGGNLTEISITKNVEPQGSGKEEVIYPLTDYRWGTYTGYVRGMYGGSIRHNKNVEVEINAGTVQLGVTCFSYGNNGFTIGGVSIYMIDGTQTFLATFYGDPNDNSIIDRIEVYLSLKQ